MGTPTMWLLCQCGSSQGGSALAKQSETTWVLWKNESPFCSSRSHQDSLLTALRHLTEPPPPPYGLGGPEAEALLAKGGLLHPWPSWRRTQGLPHTVGLGLHFSGSRMTVGEQDGMARLMGLVLGGSSCPTSSRPCTPLRNSRPPRPGAYLRTTPDPFHSVARWPPPPHPRGTWRPAWAPPSCGSAPNPHPGGPQPAPPAPPGCARPSPRPAVCPSLLPAPSLLPPASRLQPELAEELAERLTSRSAVRSRLCG